ncbi:WD40 repeat domain-containing protein, partial [Candidatus Dependentiae bacterium]
FLGALASSYCIEGQEVIASAGSNGIKLWNKFGSNITPSDSDDMANFKPDLGFNSIRFNQKGDKIITTASTKKGSIINIWDTKTGKDITPPNSEIAKAKPSHDRFEFACFNEKGDKIISTGYDIQIWDAEEGKDKTPPNSDMEKYDERVLFACLNKAEDEIITSGIFQTINIWGVKTGDNITPDIIKSRPSGLTSFVRCNNKKGQIISLENGKIKIRNAKTGEDMTPEDSDMEKYDKGVKLACFNKKGNKILSTVDVSPPQKTMYSQIYHKIKIWDAETGTDITPKIMDEETGYTKDSDLAKYQEYILQAQFNDTGTMIVSVGYRDGIKL